MRGFWLPIGAWELPSAPPRGEFRYAPYDRSEPMLPFHDPKMTRALRKLGALMFLAAIAFTPVVIVALGSKQGGIFVAGYVTGVITVPIVAFGAIRAIYVLVETTEGLVGVLVFGLLVILISVAAAFWAIFFSAH
jgi:hypothetical protein